MQPATRQRSEQLALLVIATAQLMLVLDDLIVNIALQTIQEDLRVSPLQATQEPPACSRAVELVLMNIDLRVAGSIVVPARRLDEAVRPGHLASS